MTGLECLDSQACVHLVLSVESGYLGGATMLGSGWGSAGVTSTWMHGILSSPGWGGLAQDVGPAGDLPGMCVRY